MRILITGVNGFFGKKLANYFLLKNYIVYGIGRNKKSIAVAPIPNYGLGVSINDRLLRASTVKRWTKLDLKPLKILTNLYLAC